MSDKDDATLTDAAKSEIAEAVRIVASDKSYRNLEAIRAHLIPDTPENNPPGDGDPTPPPKKEGEQETGQDDKPPKKAGIWWGDRLDKDDGS